MTSLKPEQLTEISERTLGHYNGSAASFWEGTRGHDLSQNINALLSGLRSHRSLLPAHGPAPGTTALVGQHLAQDRELPLLIDARVSDRAAAVAFILT